MIFAPFICCCTNHSAVASTVVRVLYRRTSFYCETPIIANCKIISSSHKLKCKQKCTQSMTRELVLHLQTVSSFQFSELATSLRRYFKPTNKLPTADEAGLSANVVNEVNQVVTSERTERSEASAGKKRKHTITFTSEDRAHSHCFD